MVDILPKDQRILVTAKVPPSWEDRLIRTASGADIILARKDEDALAAAREATILFGRATPEILETAERLRWCHVSSAGVNSLPLALMARKGIILTNSRVQAGAVADHAMALLLSWARQIPGAVLNKAGRTWERLPCLQLNRSTMVIVGMGAIGSEIARRASGFGMKVVGIKRSPEMMSYTQKIVSPSELDTVLKEADYVVLACPLTPQTHHLIGERQLQLMPRNAFLINIGRGDLIDEKALISALQAGEIAGAGLDVFSQEPLPEDSPLWDLDNVVMTPHVAGSRPGGSEEAVTFFMENLHRYLSGRPLLNVVNLEAGY